MWKDFTPNLEKRSATAGLDHKGQIREQISDLGVGQAAELKGFLYCVTENNGKGLKVCKLCRRQFGPDKDKWFLGGEDQIIHGSFQSLTLRPDIDRALE